VDVLEALKIDIEVSRTRLPEIFQKTGIAFMYAPTYHPSLKKIAPIRKALKFPTVFNLLGPLLNPAKAEYVLIGVPHESTLKLISQVILQRGDKKRALIFHGSGLDELTSIGPVVAYDIRGGEMTRLDINPHSLGFSPCSLAELQGGDPSKNAAILKEVFLGKEGAVADALIFTAGAAIWIYGHAATLIEGIQTARQGLKEGKGHQLLEKWILLSETYSRGNDESS
jgi:anthranilate phosphoribosyltransferase